MISRDGESWRARTPVQRSPVSDVVGKRERNEQLVRHNARNRENEFAHNMFPKYAQEPPSS